MIPSERASQEERSSTNFSSIAPSNMRMYINTEGWRHHRFTIFPLPHLSKAEGARPQVYWTEATTTAGGGRGETESALLIVLVSTLTHTMQEKASPTEDTATAVYSETCRCQMAMVEMWFRHHNSTHPLIVRLPH